MPTIRPAGGGREVTRDRAHRHRALNGHEALEGASTGASKWPSACLNEFTGPEISVRLVKFRLLLYERSKCFRFGYIRYSP
jgi:hypothetical protein